MKNLKDSPKCPNCGSTDYSIFSSRELYTDVYTCNDCQTVWDVDWETDDYDDWDTDKVVEDEPEWLVNGGWVL